MPRGPAFKIQSESTRFTPEMATRTEETPKHLRLVFSSFLRSYLDAMDDKTAKALLGEGYFDRYHREMEDHLSSGRLLVARAVDEPDTILGWALVRPDVGRLVYVYVRHDYRGQGVATALLSQALPDGAITAPSYLTHAGDELMRAWIDSR